MMNSQHRGMQKNLRETVDINNWKLIANKVWIIQMHNLRVELIW